MKSFLRSLSLLSLFAVACTPRPEDAKSNVKHDEDQFTVGPEGWNWVQDSDQEYFEYVAPLVGDPTDRAAYQPQGADLRVRVDAWLAKIHAALLAKRPDLVGETPKPEVQILITDDINAFVAPIAVCWTNVGVDFGGAGPAITDSVALYNGAFEAASYIGAGVKCLERAVTRAEVEERVRREFTDADCKVDVKEPTAGSYVVTPSTACNLPGVFVGSGVVKQLVVFRTSHWITVFTGLVKSMSESQLVAVLAHELGHYYRSHINMAHRYNYAYHLTFDRDPSQPTRIGGDNLSTDDQQVANATAVLAGMQSEQARLFADAGARQGRQFLGAFAPVSGQRIHSALYSTLSGLVYSHVTQIVGPCNEAAVAWLNSGSNADATAVPSAGLVAKYLAFEAKAEACLSGQVVNATDINSRSVGTSTWRYLPANIESVDLWDWFVRATAILRAEGPAYSLADVQAKRDNDRAAVDLNHRGELMENQFPDLEEYFDRSVIGLYSYEQEADEIGLEFLSMIGVTPKASVEVDMTFATLFGNQLGDRCKTLFDNGWLDNGQPFIVPMGRLEFHHDSCFRAFDSDREIVGHGYLSRFTFDAVFTDAAAWTALQAALPTTWVPTAGEPSVPVENPAGTHVLDFDCKFGGFKFRPEDFDEVGTVSICAVLASVQFSGR